MVAQDRAHGGSGEQLFDDWKKIIADPDNMDAAEGDAYRTTYGFSHSPMSYLRKLKIPVLVTYGTKDFSTPFNDYFRIEMIREKRTNFTFKAYIGVEHNYFPLKADGRPDFDVFNWDKVAGYWQTWLRGYSAQQR